MQKLKREMKRSLDADGSSGVNAHRDYDFDRRVADVRRLHDAIEHFSEAVTHGMVAMKKVASAFEAVGQAFTEITIGNNNTGYADDIPNPFPTEADMENLEQFSQQSPGVNNQDRQGSMGSSVYSNNASGVYAASETSTALTGETTSQVRHLARLFANEARLVNEGAPFTSYNTGIHRDVITRLRPVEEHVKGMSVYKRERNEALSRYNKYKAEVEKVEKSYAKKGKPFTNSKSYRKYSVKRDEAWKDYVKAREKFNSTFDLLMEVNDHTAAQIIHRYLVLNEEYLKQLTQSIGRVIPKLAEAYPLNNEYSTVQNRMMVDALAAAPLDYKPGRSPKQPPAAAPEDDPADSDVAGEESEESHLHSGDDGNGGDDHDGHRPPSPISQSTTLTEFSTQNLPSAEGSPATAGKTAPAAATTPPLEEPEEGGDGRPAPVTLAPPQRHRDPAFEEAAVQPPHELAEEDAVRPAAGSKAAATLQGMAMASAPGKEVEEAVEERAAPSVTIPGAVAKDRIAGPGRAPPLPGAPTVSFSPAASATNRDGAAAATASGGGLFGKAECYPTESDPK